MLQLGLKFSAARLVAGTFPKLEIAIESDVHRAGFLAMKKQDADWRSWKLRWCELNGTQFSWSKTPKIGQGTTKPTGSISVAGARIHAGRADTAARRFFRISLTSGENLFFAGESRKDTVEWTHLLQHVAGHMILTNTPADSVAAPPVDLVEPRPAEGEATREQSLEVAQGISKAGFVHFRRGRKRWYER